MSTESFHAAIFDMDGLLIDSEPLWHEAEIEILGDLGVPLVVDGCRQTKGMFVEEVTDYWFARYPWDGPKPDRVAVAIVDRVIELVLEQGTLQPGVHETIRLCQAHDIPLAVASSSQYRLIEIVLEHFDLAAAFSVVHSAEVEPFGKPHPGVFLTAAQRLGVAPDHCLVFEDSGAGVLAAKAARMACIAVPEAIERDAPAFAIADAVLNSLEQLDGALWDEVAHRHLSVPLVGLAE